MALEQAPVSMLTPFLTSQSPVQFAVAYRSCHINEFSINKATQCNA